MRRRTASVLLALGWAVVFDARAAPSARVARIGTLLSESDLENLRRSLHALGYEEGRNAAFVSRPIERSAEDLESAARELIAARVDVIVSGPGAASHASQRASSTIPIVMFYAQAPVETGLVASLARPGGNVTGTTAAPIELAGKAIELLRDALPRLRRVVVLAGRDEWSRIYLRETERAARAVGSAFGALAVESVAELEAAFAELARDPPDAIAVGIAVVPYYEQVARFAAQQRLAAIYAVIPAVVHYGGLMAYSTNYPVLMARTAAIVDRVLRGTRPAAIPVEEPTRYVLAINQRAARAIGLTIPRAVLVRADILIE